MSRDFMIIVFVASLLTLCNSLRILVFFPLSSKSHSILGQGVATHLLEAGHEVVHITSYPRDKTRPNLKEIDVSSIGEKHRKETEKYDMFKLKNLIGKGDIGDSPFFLYFVYDFHKQILDDDKVVALLTDPKEIFDTVIIEWFFHDSIAGIAALLQSPLIWFGSTEAHWQLLKLTDEIPNPSYNVDLFSTSRPPMSFWERTVELWTMLKKSFIFNVFVVPFEKLLYNRVFPKLAAKRGVIVPTYNEAVYNGSLTLLNSHPSLGTPFKLPQSAKYIAGYHIDNKVKPLPMNLQKLMDEAKHGVIYFSMGSNLRSADMSDEMKESLLNMFGELKQIIIWKFESDLKNVPANIHLVKWAPQQSILAHPNLKLFITHGGQLSTTESIHYGVPVIGMPIMGDQHVNMKSVEHKGFGIKVELSNHDAINELSAAIHKVLSNSEYKAKAMELSLVYHDRMSSPGAELVHWVEHVVRTRGGPHLRSPALHVPLYQKMYLDLAAVVAAIATALFISIKRIARWKSTIKPKAKKP